MTTMRVEHGTSHDQHRRLFCAPAAADQHLAPVRDGVDGSGERLRQRGALESDDVAFDAFERRIGQDRATEFEEACRQVERIADFRLKDILP